MQTTLCISSDDMMLASVVRAGYGVQADAQGIFVTTVIVYNGAHHLSLFVYACVDVEEVQEEQEMDEQRQHTEDDGRGGETQVKECERNAEAA